MSESSSWSKRSCRAAMSSGNSLKYRMVLSGDACPAALASWRSDSGLLEYLPLNIRCDSLSWCEQLYIYYPLSVVTPCSRKNTLRWLLYV